MRMLTAMLVLLAWPAAAQQQPAGNAANGQRLAAASCATCHVVEGSGTGWTDAPGFAAIAARPQVNAAWLRDFFGKPHLNMLYTDRPANEAADISAYILSLKRR